MSLKAGAAVADISPAGPVPLFGYPHVERISTGVHDPLLSSSLYLENGSQALLLTSLDLLFLDAPTARSIRRAVAQRLSLPEAHVFVSCTHTHSGPVTHQLLAWRDDLAVPPPDPAYLEWLTERVVESASQAAGRARPAEMAWTTAKASGIGGNRLDPAGPSDPEVGILVVRAAGQGPVLALTVIYGMHPTVLHETSKLISSDFPHYTREQLKGRFGPSLTVVYHNGACGNQSPRHFVRGYTFAEAERLGRALGHDIELSVEQLTADDFRSDIPLLGRLQTVVLPPRQLPSKSEAELQLARCCAEYHELKSKVGESIAARTAECAVFGAEGTLTLARLADEGEIAKAIAARRPIELQAVRIGDACIAGLPGEVFAEYALDLKHRAPGKVFVVTLANGELQGYIVTRKAVAEGGYEALTALYSPAAGDILVAAALALVTALATPQTKGMS